MLAKDIDGGFSLAFFIFQVSKTTNFPKVQQKRTAIVYKN
jgi:hypothetical protein